MVGDPEDENAPIRQQKEYLEALSNAGVRAWLIEIVADGKRHHNTVQQTQQIGLIVINSQVLN